MFDPAPGTAVRAIGGHGTRPRPSANQFNMPSEPRAVAFSPDGKRVAAVCAGGQIALIDVEQHKIVQIWKYSTPIRRMPESARASGSIAFSPDGTAVLTWGLDESLRRVGRGSGKQRCHLQLREGSLATSRSLRIGANLATAQRTQSGAGLGLESRASPQRIGSRLAPNGACRLGSL